MKQYTVIFEPAGENYSAYVPDLPGCIACGDTIEETEALMKEAIELYIEALERMANRFPNRRRRPARLPSRGRHVAYSHRRTIQPTAAAIAAKRMTWARHIPATWSSTP